MVYSFIELQDSYINHIFFSKKCIQTQCMIILNFTLRKKLSRKIQIKY